MSGRFTYNYQLAGYPFERYDDKGAVDYDTFVTAFECFPWGEQMRQRETMFSGCSATISVVDHEKRFDYWVSVLGDDEDPTFLLGAVYDKRVRKPFRFKRTRVVRWVEMRVAPSRASVLQTFGMFFADETEMLMRTFRSYRLLRQSEKWKPSG